MKHGAERYSSKTDDYAKYRPSFPSEIVDFLYTNDIINGASVIADIGSGTGRFTRLLLDKGNLVYGVEQNNEMRKKAEVLLSHYSNFISVAGSAENTSLADRSIGLITAAQAFHWFNKEKCISEFRRIIKADGKVFIIWDDLVCDYNDFSIEFGSTLAAFRNVESENMGRRLSRTEMIDGLFKDNKYEKLTFTHELYQNFDSIKGGASSASFTPKPEEGNYEPFIQELQKVFNKYQNNDQVCTAFQSLCFLGEL